MELSSYLPILIDGVIGLTVIEGIALLAYHRLTGGGVRPEDFLRNLVSGLCLMGALRSALHKDGAAWLALWLLAAGIAHGADLFKRWKRRGPVGLSQSLSVSGHENELTEVSEAE